MLSVVLNVIILSVAIVNVFRFNTIMLTVVFYSYEDVMLSAVLNVFSLSVMMANVFKLKVLY
jgi:hypothetical protein